MSLAVDHGVAVIIAARNAAATIAEAVASALSQRRVSEVLVIDDASQDDTAGAAMSADDGSGRVRVISLDRQVGPSRARNLAIDNTSASLIAVLDGDDVFLPGRFDWLLEDDGWDFVADNIIMYGDVSSGLAVAAELATKTARPLRPVLNLSSFVEGNISGRVRRRELGFLKPVMRREFLVRAGLRYDESIRFAEDYDLYCRALIAGARFRVDSRVGYGALVRDGSLSATHTAGDLAALLNIDERLLGAPGLDDKARASIASHRRHVSSKHYYRTILDLRRRDGRPAAVKAVLATPLRIPDAVAHFTRDKLQAWRPQKRRPADGWSLLLSPEMLAVMTGG